MFSMEWLPRKEAYLLREVDGQLMAAQTTEPPQVLAAGGRAVIFFQNGRFEVKWVNLRDFEELRAAQQEQIRRLAAKAGEERATP